MPAEARITSVWYKQKLFVSLFVLAFGAYFFWDGLYTWPRSNERYQAHEELVKADREKDWPALAAQHNWTTEVPHKFYKRKDILGQWVFGTLLTLLGLVSLTYWFTQKDRTVKTDDEAVYSPAGTRIPFSTITGLGKKDWEGKGYATVLYKIQGRKGRFKLDDYKFDRDATHQILAEIEEKLATRQE